MGKTANLQHRLLLLQRWEPTLSLPNAQLTRLDPMLPASIVLFSRLEISWHSNEDWLGSRQIQIVELSAQSVGLVSEPKSPGSVQLFLRCGL